MNAESLQEAIATALTTVGDAPLPDLSGTSEEIDNLAAKIESAVRGFLASPSSRDLDALIAALDNFAAQDGESEAAFHAWDQAWALFESLRDGRAASPVRAEPSKAMISAAEKAIFDEWPAISELYLPGEVSRRFAEVALVAAYSVTEATMSSKRLQLTFLLTEVVERGPVFEHAAVDGTELASLVLDASMWDNMNRPEMLAVVVSAVAARTEQS